MSEYRWGPFELHLMKSPRVFFRIGPLILMWWPKEPWARKLEICWRW